MNREKSNELVLIQRNYGFQIPCARCLGIWCTCRVRDHMDLLKTRIYMIDKSNDHVLIQSR